MRCIKSSHVQQRRLHLSPPPHEIYVVHSAVSTSVVLFYGKNLFTIVGVAMAE